MLGANADSQCHSYNTNYNYNYYNSPLTAGWNKKMEALLHRVLNELSEMREEIKFFKGNKTIGGTNILIVIELLAAFLYLLENKRFK